MRVPTRRIAERTWEVRREQRDAVDQARRFAELAVAACDSEDRRATAMAVSEFSENLIKYSSRVEGSAAGTIAIGIDRDVIRLRVTNAAVSYEDARRVQDTVSRLASSADVQSLYRKRLEELFKNPRLPRAQLGLLRVAFEGGFRLSCSFDPPLLVIVAERSRYQDP
jgi:anti-sigma regulatory factor (Ser/Thr protein kinase)